MCDEPGIPSEITDPSGYSYDHTRQWSAEISSHSAFIFVTPQYNWSFPASIKNAIDYLYHEWKGKPAVIVSYGGHGGGKAAAQLHQVLLGIRMRVMETRVELQFPGKGFLLKASRGEDLELHLEDGSTPWANKREEFTKAFNELVTAPSA
jgi:NAD(P)H-dependent FMN reductase